MATGTRQANARKVLGRVADAIAGVEPNCSAVAVEMSLDRSRLRVVLE